MVFALDTNILSEMRFRPAIVRSSAVAITAWTLMEIALGSMDAPELADVQSFFRFVTSNIPVLGFDAKAALIYARLRSERIARRVDSDAIIAATVISHGATFVTRDRGFSRFNDLKRTRW